MGKQRSAALARGGRVCLKGWARETPHATHRTPPPPRPLPQPTPKVADLILVGMIGLRTDAAALFTLCALGMLFYLLAQQVQSFAAIVTPNQVRPGRGNEGLGGGGS
jgi:hypothetical protein